MSVSTSTTTVSGPTYMDTPVRVGILHGAGYVGGELVRLLTGHPEVALEAVTSRTFAGRPIAAAHPSLRGQVPHEFVPPEELSVGSLDVILVAGEHGQSMKLVPDVLDDGFAGPIVDLSGDFRFSDPDVYPVWFDVEHPAPGLLDEAVYGLPEWGDAVGASALIANPGCYATGIALALAPLAMQERPFSVHVTALTGASGSGASASAATHFPARDGNVRPYKVLSHQHEPEITQTLGPHVDLHFVPASGPWTRGIWGTAQVDWPGNCTDEEVGHWFAEAYDDATCVRCSPGTLPSLKPAVGTPFCDIGWRTKGEILVVGFALDNLLKGAASQAIQNLNRALGLPEAVGLLPTTDDVHA